MAVLARLDKDRSVSTGTIRTAIAFGTPNFDADSQTTLGGAAHRAFADRHGD
ncbi:MAG: hypothetical protein KDK24_06800 [Pseudooceanicola sp.]|nr:hypothetical protein [Pseudooceanicola sp.]